MAKRVKPKNLDVIRDQYKALQAQANARISQLREAGVENFSRAYNDAVAKYGAYRTDYNEDFRFDVYDTKRFREIKREVSLMEKFLNDETSKLDVIQLNLAKEKYEGAFSGKWYEKYGVTYDKSRVSEDEAKVAFSIYRRLEESGISYQTMLGRSGYGSENLIMLIYDMVVQEGVTEYNEDNIEYWDRYGNVRQRAEEIIENNFKERDAFAEEMRDTGDEDTGILFELMKNSGTSLDWMSKLNF